MLDEAKVDCLELAIPFPNSASDGPVIRRSASRALEDGVDREAVLDFVGDVRPELEHLKIALLADWSYSIKGTPMREFLEHVQATGADGLLVHGLPPRLKPEYYEAAGTVDLPIVTTCYATSDPAVLNEAAEHGSAYIYLVAAYGRSGTVGPPDHSTLIPVLETLRGRPTCRSRSGSASRTRATSRGSGRSAPTPRSSAARAWRASPTRGPPGATWSKTSAGCSLTWDPSHPKSQRDRTNTTKGPYMIIR